MKIGGLIKTSFIDYPGKISAVIFTKGCNFRCPFCHNPELVNGDDTEIIDENEVLEFLEKRKDLLDGVVITGGEPLVQPNLKSFLKKIKKIGYDIKLDTNGSSPQKLKELIYEKLIDFVAMDYKAPIEKYDYMTQVKVDSNLIKESINIIKKSKIYYELRTTQVNQMLTEEDIKQIKTEIKGFNHIFQPFRDSGKILNREVLGRGL